jgi:chromate transport protein ChrA
MAAFRSPGLFPPPLAGALGGLLATWVTFTPCFLWIFAGAPYIEQLRGNKPLSGALSAITAAVVGVVLNLAIWFAVHSVFRATRHVGGFGLSFDAPVLTSLDVWSFILALGAAIAIFRFKVGMIPTLVGSCAVGAALHAFGVVAWQFHAIKENKHACDKGNCVFVPFSAVRSACDSGRDGLEESRSPVWPHRGFNRVLIPEEAAPQFRDDCAPL